MCDIWGEAHDLAQAKAIGLAIFAHLGANDSHAQRSATTEDRSTWWITAHEAVRPRSGGPGGGPGITVRDMPAEARDDAEAGLGAVGPFPY